MVDGLVDYLEQLNINVFGPNKIASQLEGSKIFTKQLCQKFGYSINDFDVIELNEAFASQALYCIRELGLDMDKTNVNGSGISLGHPVGATGAIMTVKIMEEMEQSDMNLGLVTMCVGGGQGIATIFERVN